MEFNVLVPLISESSNCENTNLLADHKRPWCHQLLSLPRQHQLSVKVEIKNGGDNNDCDNANPVVNAGTSTIEEPLPPLSAGQLCIVRKLANEQFCSCLV
jgi:hypothetical protein